MKKDLFESMQQLIDMILSNYDHAAQLDILEEELAELLLELKHYQRNRPSDIPQEMTHVLISTFVVKQILNISDEQLENEMNKKMTAIRNRLGPEN